jgi:hypothetical protein
VTKYQAAYKQITQATANKHAFDAVVMTRHTPTNPPPHHAFGSNFAAAAAGEMNAASSSEE